MPDHDRTAVVDGANVAWEETGDDESPRVANLIEMIEVLEGAGYSPITVVDASLHHEIDDPDRLEALLDDGTVSQSPAGTDADRFILTIAEDHDAVVVSNDLFDSYRSEYSWLDERRLPFMILGGEVYLDPEFARQAD